MKRYLLAALLIVSVLALTAVFWGSARADGGQWPTPTPTLIPGLFQATPVPAEPIYPPASIQNEIPTQPALLQATIEPVPTAAPSTSRLSSYLCWPFAIAFILIVVIASTALIGRRSS